MTRPSVAVLRRPSVLIVEGILAVAGLFTFVFLYFAPQDLLLDSTIHDAVPTATVPADPSVLNRSGTRTSAPTVLRHGRFRSGEHRTSGTALLLELADFRVFVRLEHLNTSDGPNVHIWLTAARDDAEDGTVRRSPHVDLGDLLANHGDQNYLVPAGTDLSAYRTVTVWCQRFHVVFGAAPLRAL